MPQPNFLFLMTDHQQARTVNTDVCHTPNVDRISAEGVRFNRNYTVNAICSPTRASLMTGLHVHGHGMYDCTHASDPCRSELREGVPMWSEALADAGYHSAYFGKWHVERSNDLSQLRAADIRGVRAIVHAVPVDVQAGHQRRARGRADRVHRVVAVEAHALGGDAVHVGRVTDVGVHRPRLLVIGHQEEEVGLRH